MKAASRPQMSNPLHPTGRYRWTTSGRICSKSTFVPIFARSGLKNTIPSTATEVMSRNRGSSDTSAITMFSSAASLGLRVESTCWIA